MVCHWPHGIIICLTIGILMKSFCVQLEWNKQRAPLDNLYRNYIKGLPQTICVISFYYFQFMRSSLSWDCIEIWTRRRTISIPDSIIICIAQCHKYGAHCSTKCWCTCTQHKPNHQHDDDNHSIAHVWYE